MPHVLIGLALVILGAGIANAQPARPARHALIVGIGEYRHLPRLRGPENDVIVARDLIRRVFGVPRGAMTVLVDERATGTAIRGALADIEQRVARGDEVVFYFSGHGSQVLDHSQDEPDRRDETLVPVDSGRGGQPNTDIIDDELASWLTAIEAKGARATLIFDSCHAGTVHKDRGVREVPYDPAPPVRQTTRSDGAAAGLLPPLKRTVLLAAARAEEPARERARDGRVYGVLTWHLAQILSGAAPPLSWRGLEQRLRAGLAAAGEAQHVQLVGAHSRALRSGGATRPVGLLLEREGDQLFLPLGAVHGVGEGSTFTVRGGTAPIIGTVTAVEPTRSRLTLAGAPGGGELRAFERTRMLPVGPVVVRLGAGVSSAIGEALAKAFHEMRFHRSADRPAHLAIDVDGSKAVVGVPTTTTPTRVAPTAAAIGDALRIWRRWVAVERLARDHDAIDVSVRLEDEAGRPVERPLRPGEHVWVSVENHQPTPVYLNLVHLGSDGGVTPLHPRDGAQEPLARLAKWRSTRLRATLPAGVDRATDRLKVIVTRTFVDLWPLSQSAPKAGATEDALTRLLRDTMRGVRPKSGAQPDAWSADTLVIEVERP